jgi:oxygen-independent coproporphyrinogen-3 oxidase
MGLRLAEGIDLPGRGLEPFLNWDAIAKLSEQGLLKRNNGRIAATSEGMLLLDAILREIVA